MTQLDSTWSRAARIAGIVLGVGGLLLVAGCSSNGSSGGTGASGAHGSSGSKPVITVSPSTGNAVSPNAKVVVKTDHGKLDLVTVKAADGSVVAGSLSADNTEWSSDPQLLQFGTKYKVVASAADGSSRTTTDSSFQVKQTKGLHAFVSPNARTVGVGMPIIVTLTAKPSSRAAVESRLKVTSSKPIVGAWHWFSDTELHYRPKDFWPADDHVTIRANLQGVKFGKNTYGDHNTTASFTTGQDVVSIVDVANHTLTYTVNGKVVRVIPVTTGKASLPTRGGIKVIISKQHSTIMDSATVDIPAGSPDAYKLRVFYAMRLTWSGEYIHAAPWSVSSQGVANVSHGCTGMSNANAIWMYNHSRVGDVVKYINSTRPLEQGNGYTDWNMPWSQWLAGSALV